MGPVALNSEKCPAPLLVRKILACLVKKQDRSGSRNSWFGSEAEILSSQGFSSAIE